MVVADSSDITMCYYNQDMIQINEMNANDVTVQINNVWTRDALPGQLRIFTHTDSVDAILDREDGDGFQCLDSDGTDVDIEGENEISIQCFQESEGAPWLAVIDVVITDDMICATNEVLHPCFPDGGIIHESCSWRIVIPCEEEVLCTEEPTSSPSNSPSAKPTESPSSSPSFNPTGSPSSSPSISVTSSPTVRPTARPTERFTQLGPPSDDGNDDFVYRPDCPEDITVLKHSGVTDLPDGSVRIVSQDSSNVTVQLVQTYTDSSSAISSWYYQYHKDTFSDKCYGDTDVEGESIEEITIQCFHQSQIALLEFWIADDISNGVLVEGDNAIIPECCHPSDPEGTPVTKYTIQIRCETACPEVVE